ncbi:hypothetical protein [Orientia tsutsugamushi]|uniref:hypothetical protein n=1 Tax=Orientia tsutsugamushi TaxID=784 RepID=UPI0035BE8BD0
MIAGYVNNKSIAPMIFNGACNTRLFETWVQQVLINRPLSKLVKVVQNYKCQRSN